ncbi:hypothetical protein SS50377_24389 [Spironucleus salmonicida]|uniref:Uncharacterized protein n=1 Tax=Spironucleus salmonicida TaxID=348837 RepID=V6LQT1_9EUKA|nr:hypothetical protein SS50377_24389 [Spironucleus salmonicida]|eukprot:EST46061.1 Hypothetical protein SS50377_14051 [Spironucleus salmonicida]
MRSVKLSKQQVAKELQEEKQMKYLDEQEKLRKMNINTKIDKNVVPKLEQKDTYEALKKVELQEQLDNIKRKIKTSDGLERQLFNKKAMLLLLALQIEDESHPIFDQIKLTNKQLSTKKEMQKVVENGLLNQVHETNEPIEEQFGQEEENAQFEDSDDSAISLSELPNYIRVSKEKEHLDMSVLGIKQKASLGEADTVGMTLEERARQFKQDQRLKAKQEIPEENFLQKAQKSKLDKDDKIIRIQQKKQVITKKKEWIEDKAEQGESRVPGKIIRKNRNAIGEFGNNKQISKLNLKKKFNKYEVGKSQVLKNKRTAKIDGYFGERNIVMKKKEQ